MFLKRDSAVVSPSLFLIGGCCFDRSVTGSAFVSRLLTCTSRPKPRPDVYMRYDIRTTGADVSLSP